MGLRASDFRQHYIPSPPLWPEDARHWMLDWFPARELLKTIVRKRYPEAGVPLFGPGAEFDFELDLIIDELGWRDLAAPDDAWAHLRFSAMFFVMTLRARIARSHQPQSLT